MIDPDGRNEILHISEKDPCSFPIEVWCHIPTRPAWEEDPWPPFPPGGNGPRPPSPTPDDPDGDDEEDGEDEVREREEKECIANTYGVVGVMADKAGFWGVGALAAGVAKDLAIHGTAWIYGKTAENLVPLVGRQIATPGAASTLGFMAENALKWESVWAGVGKTLLATSVGATGFSIGMRMHCGSLDGDI